MKNIVLSIFIVFASLSKSLSAQAPSVEIHGGITDEVGGTSMEGAMVSLLQPHGPKPTIAAGETVLPVPLPGEATEYHETAGAGGTFKIAGIRPGKYLLLVYKAGYIDTGITTEDAIKYERAVRVVVISPEATQLLNIVMRKSPTISGRIIFDTNEPAHTNGHISQAVAANAELEAHAGHFIRFGNPGHTDSSGNYTIDNLVPGTYVIFAAIPTPMDPPKRGLVGGVSRVEYAPSSIRQSAARRVVVPVRGSVTGVDVVVPLSNLHRVTGRVVDQQGNSISVGYVSLVPDGEPSLSRGLPCGPNGEFTFSDVQGEHYTLVYISEGNTQFLGPTPDGKAIRVKTTQAPYAQHRESLSVGNKNIGGLVLRVESNAKVQATR